jgi:hypothetical protein
VIISAPELIAHQNHEVNQGRSSEPREAFQLKKGIVWLEKIILLSCETA